MCILRKAVQDRERASLVSLSWRCHSTAQSNMQNGFLFTGKDSMLVSAAAAWGAGALRIQAQPGRGSEWMNLGTKNKNQSQKQNTTYKWGCWSWRSLNKTKWTAESNASVPETSSNERTAKTVFPRMFRKMSHLSPSSFIGCMWQGEPARTTQKLGSKPETLPSIFLPFSDLNNWHSSWIYNKHVSLKETAMICFQ